MFTEEDLKKYMAFKNIVGQGKFEIRGEAIIMASSLFQWFDELGSKIHEQVYPKPQQPLQLAKSDNKKVIKK